MWLIKAEEETDPRYGKRPEDRSLAELIPTSLIVTDKHAGPTSHQITAWLRGLFKVKKAGHAGTLDPKVTGVLPVALGTATRAMPVLMGLDKEYVGVARLHQEVSEELLRRTILDQFIGKIRQVPPVRAAVVRKPRERQIYFFDILEIDGKNFLFKVGCEAGTYVRKLIHDLGTALGVGAHLLELRRTRVGHFGEGQAHPIMAIRDAYELWAEGDERPLRHILMPIEHAILHVKRIFVRDSAIHSITSGAPLYVAGICRVQQGIERGQMVAVYSLKEELIALGVAHLTSREMYELSEGVAVKTDRVFMGRDVYP